MILIHFTRDVNVDSILEKGLLPEFALGSIKRIWLTVWENCQWAAEHTSYRHEIQPHRMAVIVAKASGQRLAHHGRHVYYTGQPILPGNLKAYGILSATAYREEKGIPRRSMGVLDPLAIVKGRAIFLGSEVVNG
jgi:hypothetical protein